MFVILTITINVKKRYIIIAIEIKLTGKFKSLLRIKVFSLIKFFIPINEKES
jgi:hypothetical protein